MATQDDIHKDLYQKLNSNTAEMKELTGAVKVLTAQNERFFKMIEKKDELFLKALRALFWIAVLLIAALIYGALGDKGFNAIADRIPAVPANTNVSLYPDNSAGDKHKE